MQDRGVLTGFLVSDELPVLSSERDDSQRVFGAVVVRRDVLVVEEHAEGIPLIQRILDGAAHRSAGRQTVLVREKPGVESLHRRPAFGLAQAPVCGRSQDVQLPSLLLDTVDLEDQPHRFVGGIASRTWCKFSGGSSAWRPALCT